MKKNNIPFIPVGISSLLITFLILCLAVFSVLSLSSAVAEQKLSQKTADHILEYYTASNTANDTLAAIDEILAASAAKAQDRDTYFHLIEASLASLPGVQFSVNGKKASVFWNTIVNDSQVLSVSLSIPYPINEGEALYKIRQWQVINTADWTPDQSQHVYRRNEKEGK